MPSARINKKLPKEHLGYIIDRVGFETFKQEILEGIKINTEAKIVKPNNPGYLYETKDNKR